MKRPPRLTIPADAPKTKAPERVRPMLATLVAEPFDRDDWVFEIKFDGYRAIADVRRRGVSLYSRNFKSFAERYAPVADTLTRLGHEAVLDGEIVVTDDAGRPQFQLLQNYKRTGQGQPCYYVFDILHLDGHDLRELPLRRRKSLLEKLLVGSKIVLVSKHVEHAGIALFKDASRAGLEGIMAKDARSPYREGVRSREWFKIKTQQRQEVVIAGFTEPRGSRKALGALVLGVYESKNLVYVGHTGGGFDDAGLVRMRQLLEPLEQKECPFKERPRTNAPVHWVEPRLVCEVKFSEWTGHGHLRQPIFLSLREDKDAREVRRERPAAV
jgi:bifunctional non-homologous end joining protein LigD